MQEGGEGGGLLFNWGIGGGHSMESISFDGGSMSLLGEALATKLAMLTGLFQKNNVQFPGVKL